MELGVNSARAATRLSRRRALGMLAMAALLPETGCAKAAAGGPQGRRSAPVLIASGQPTGVYYWYGEALAALLTQNEDRPVDNISTTGSVDNLTRLANGQATVAFTAADAATDAYGGTFPFSAPVPLRAIASLYDDYVHLVVRADSPIHDITDLRNLRVSLGPPGSGTALLAERLLGLAGLTSTDITSVPLGITESVVALRDRRISAFFWSGGLPTAGIAELAAHTPIRLLSLASLSAAMRSNYSVSCRTGLIQRGIYANVPPVTTLAIPDLLVTTANADDEFVFDLTKLLFTTRDRLARRVSEAAQLDPRTAIYTQPIPLHPAAARFYRTAKP